MLQCMFFCFSWSFLSFTTLAEMSDQSSGIVLIVCFIVAVVNWSTDGEAFWNA